MAAARGTFRLAHEDDTTRLGAALAGALKVGEAICLEGPLGAGKSVLARGLVRQLTTDDEEVPSPTFTLVQVYHGDPIGVAHFDLYRLSGPEEVYELGLDDALEDGAAIIEWPERLGRHRPPDWLDIEITLDADEQTRHARLTPHGAWEDRSIDF